MTALITPLYALPLVALFLLFSWRVIAERRGKRFAYGDNDSSHIQAKISAQGNWTEYTPITLFLMLTAELTGVSAPLVYATGLVLLIGRVMRGIGMSYIPKQFFYRKWKVLLTLIAVALAMFANVLAALLDSPPPHERQCAQGGSLS